MPLRFRKRIRLFGPLWLNLSKSGASLSARVGRWSWNSRSRQHSIDIPGPVNWQSRPTRRHRRRRNP